MPNDLYPLLFKPIYKSLVWGGDRIPRLFNREAQPGPCAESWEISDRPEGTSIVTNGPLVGRTLRQLIEAHPAALLGRACKSPAFPLLIKILDARERLSVQVHPDDTTAARFGGEAKTEMWYVLEADPSARMFAGFVQGTTEASFRKALADGRLESILSSVPAVPGKAVFMPGGLVHAIGEGCLLLEVQQNSNTTYRVYDWGRVDKDNKPRELHLEKALQVIDWKAGQGHLVEPSKAQTSGSNIGWDIIRCPYFTISRVDLTTPENATHDGTTFTVAFAASGTTEVSANGIKALLPRGTSCLIPAAVPTFTFTPVNGPATLVICQLT